LHLIGLARCILQQRGLPDTGLTRDDQHATLPYPRASNQRRDPLLFGFATDQHRSIVGENYQGGHLIR
jgi:hypothetical protein